MNQQFEKLYHWLEKQQLTALLISDKLNRRYLCGFTGSSGLLVASPTKNTLIIDGRYTEQAKQQTQAVEIYTLKAGEKVWSVVARLVKGRVGVEEESLLLSDYLALQRQIAAVELIPTHHAVEQLRMIKTPAELVKLQQAADLADQTFERLVTIIRPGMTELELANEIDYFSKTIGSEGPAFETIVASGVRTALPHAHASQKEIQPNELIMVDFGCIVEGYYSDLTRTFALGKVSEVIQECYQLVLAAQQKALVAIKLGESLAAVDQAARVHLAQAGQAEYFTHGLGHGIGLSCHEYPDLNQTSQALVHSQMVFTVEPGIYYEGQFGIRIEDDVYVDEQGEANCLTKSKKEWMKISWK